jgi:hypothetical protein
MAWNFFVTAEHLPDWALKTKPKVLGGKSKNKFKREHPLTRVCENCANGAKHCVPDVVAKDKRNISVDDTGCEMTSVCEDDVFEDDIFEKWPVLVVYLTPDEVAEFKKFGFEPIGAKIEVPRLATRILEFWRNHINP